jgi:hypothetical protein
MSTTFLPQVSAIKDAFKKTDATFLEKGKFEVKQLLFNWADSSGALDGAPKRLL